jgi:hypothetical protein
MFWGGYWRLRPCGIVTCWYEKATEKVKAMHESGRLALQDKDALKTIESMIKASKDAMNSKE